jgi:pentatricopeptide repeat protein
MMEKHNVKYNEVTWNTIINGYANAQNIPETAAAIKMMEQQGFPIDHYTMKSLRYLRDPERLWVSMEELDDQQVQKSGQPTPALESTFDVHVDTEERDLLIDRGLEKLKPRL